MSICNDFAYTWVTEAPADDKSTFLHTMNQQIDAQHIQNILQTFRASLCFVMAW